MSDFGGKLRFTIDGRTLIPRGTVKVDESDIEVDSGTNQDGTVWFSMKPDAYGAQVTLEIDDASYSVSQLMRWRGTAVYVEEDTGVTYTFARAGFTGKPEVDRANGEISGLTLRAARMGKTKG